VISLDVDLWDDGDFEDDHQPHLSGKVSFRADDDGDEDEEDDEDDEDDTGTNREADLEEDEGSDAEGKDEQIEWVEIATPAGQEADVKRALHIIRETRGTDGLTADERTLLDIVSEHKPKFVGPTSITGFETDEAVMEYNGEFCLSVLDIDLC